MLQAAKEEGTLPELKSDIDEESVCKAGYERKTYRNPNLTKKIDKELLDNYLTEDSNAFPELTVPETKRNRIVPVKVYQDAA